MRSTPLAVLAAGLVLVGCGSTDHYASGTAQSLEQRVLGIATAAKSQNYASALQQLSQLQTADDQALADGNITRSRHDEIAASITAVRADLSTLATPAQQTPTPSPKAHPTKHDRKGDGGNGNGGGD